MKPPLQDPNHITNKAMWTGSTADTPSYPSKRGCQDTPCWGHTRAHVEGDRFPHTTPTATSVSELAEALGFHI